MDAWIRAIFANAAARLSSRVPALWASDFLSGLVGLLADEDSQADETAEKLLATQRTAAVGP